MLLAWTWIAYCASLPWVWPWYLLPGIALAALSGPGRAAAMTAALTAGGLIFWIGWKLPGVPSAAWLFEHRALLLFGPALALAVLPLLAEVAAAVGSFGTLVSEALVERARARRPLSSADADA
jgi:hypothetical protein